jgi:polysaccharide pyruvyl transferase WcaK-like protein
MRRIIVVAGYGHYNHGDDAQALSVVHRLREAMPSAEISVAINHSYDHDEIPECTRNPLVYLVTQLLIPEKSRLTRRIYQALGIFGILYEHLSRRFRVRCLLVQGWLYAKTGLIFSFKKSVRQILEIIRSGHLLYIAGGGNWNDIWLWDGLVTRMILVRLFYYSGKPVVISGQGVGPLKSRYGRRFLKKSLRYVNMVTLRDPEGSERLLREIGVRGPKLMSVGDDSYGLDSASREKTEEVIREAGLDPSDPIMGVQVRLTTWHRKEVMVYAPAIAAILDRMVEIFGVKILFVPTEFKPDGGWDDRDHSYHVLRHMRYYKQAVVIHSEIYPTVGKALPRCCQMFLATAYHPCVFALEAGVPTVSIYGGDYHKRRAKGLFRFYDLDEYAIEYSEATPERVEKLFRTLLATRDSFIQHAREVNARIRKNIDVTISQSVELLKGTTDGNT